MQEMIAINIILGDRSYRIRVQPSDEEVVRKTVKTINDKVIEFKTQFAGKDMQDYVAMVLLWFATQVKGTGQGSPVEEDFGSQLALLERQLDEALR